jgi:hypothetical protein
MAINAAQNATTHTTGTRRRKVRSFFFWIGGADKIASLTRLVWVDCETTAKGEYRRIWSDVAKILDPLFERIECIHTRKIFGVARDEHEVVSDRGCGDLRVRIGPRF